MTNTILIDSSFSFLYSSNSKKKTEASTGNAYLDMLKSALADETDNNDSSSDMTMDEYKNYIGEKMQKLSRHSSRADSTAMVNISTEGWERMKSDPSYEKWVLDTLQSKLSSSDPWADLGSSSYSSYSFGATIDEFKEENWGKDYPGDIKSYLTSEIFGNNSSSDSTENLWLKILEKKQRAANQKSMQELTDSIAKLQQLNLLKSNGNTLNSLQNSAYLMAALNSYTK